MGNSDEILTAGTYPSAVKTVTIAVNDDSDNFNSSPTALNSGTERVAAIDYSGDVDCFSFTPQETGSYKIYSSGSVDLKGILYENDKKTAIGTSYNAPESINFKLARTLEKNKTYYIRVDAEINGATGRYSINIEKIDEPDDEYPAMYNCDNMIIVAAMNYNGNLCNFSNYGGPTQIAAPGDIILSTFATTKTYYRFSGGTSMAAPHVSGVAALIWSYYKNLTAAQVKQRIISPNNVSYSNKLDGKVSSNGCLNAWYAFSNDSASPRKIPRRESLLYEIQKRKERIAEIKSKKPDNEKTTGIFVKSLNDNCIDILNECLSSYKYEIVKQYDVTGIYLLEFDSIEHADEAINLLNARSDIKFAEPNYVLTLGGDY